MSNEDDDLWGPLPDATATEIPEDVLVHQAELLSEKTRGTLVGEVRRVDTDYGRSRFQRGHQDAEVELSLHIRVPRMDNYLYHLLSISYNIARLYPVSVVPTHDEWEPESCADTAEFKACLRRILRHSDTQTVLSALIAHAEDPRERLRESRKQFERSKQTTPQPETDDDLPF